MGRDRVDHGPGGCDDIANAAAGALIGALNEAGPVSVTVNYMPWERAPVEPEPDAETNFQEAKADHEAGMLSGRDLRWFLAERAKRGM